MAKLNNINLIWEVWYGFAYSSHIYSELFLTEKEARDFYDSKSNCAYRDIGQVHDIWNWRERRLCHD